MDELAQTLEDFIDDTRLSARPSVEHLRKRSQRRHHRRLLGSSVVVVALVLGLIVGLLPGHSPNTVRNSVTELTAFRAGTTAFSQAGGPPVFSYGVIGTKQLWVLNGDGLFISRNGGSSFQTITPPLGGSPFVRVLAVQFLNLSDGWVLANTSEGPTLGLFRTTDGGSTWSLVSLPTFTPEGINGATMDVVNHTDGFISLNGYVSQGTTTNVLLSTTDGGLTWSVVNRTSPVRYVEFTGTEVGWGLDGEGTANHLYRTDDGGGTWTEASLSVQDSASDSSVRAISWELPSFFGERGVIVGRTLGMGVIQPVIMSSIDGGSAWNPAPRPPVSQPACTTNMCANSLLPFAAVSGSHWCYWSGIDFYTTDDSGLAWTKWLPNIAFAKSNRTIVNFVAGSQYGNLAAPITFSSVSDGWAIASSGNVSLILSTHDAGHHFIAFHSPAATS